MFPTTLAGHGATALGSLRVAFLVLDGESRHHPGRAETHTPASSGWVRETRDQFLPFLGGWSLSSSPLPLPRIGMWQLPPTVVATKLNSTSRGQ